MKITTIAGLSVMALAVSISAAQAVPAVRAGVLECQGGKNVGFVVGSVANLNCVFQSNGRRPEPYTATIQRIGVDLGFTENTRLAWAVSAPTNRVGLGELSGTYGGVGANASVGVGFGGNVLLGGPAHSFALQPISVQGQTGLNVTAGIANLQLEHAPFQRGGGRHFRRHHRR